jgi:hypothetical protein
VNNAALVPLGNGGAARIDHGDWIKCLGFAWYQTANGYVAAMRGRTIVLLHRHVMDARPGEIVDHVNGDKLDNRHRNLRRTTQQQNQFNRHRLNANNTSGALGVCRSGRRWRAYMTIAGRQIHLGTYDTVDDAVEARRAGEVHYLGQECPR